MDIFLYLDQIPHTTAQQKRVRIVNGKPHFYDGPKIKEARQLQEDSYRRMHINNDPERITMMALKLKDHFALPDPVIAYGLSQLEDHLYSDLIYMRFRDGYDMEYIARYYNTDVVTITRQMDQLLLLLFNYCYDLEVPT